MLKEKLIGAADWTRGNWPIITFVSVLVAVLFIAIAEDQGSRDSCADQGGHVVDMGGTGIGVGLDGKMVTTFNYKPVCLSDDGRILAK